MIAASGRPTFHVMAKPIGPVCNLDCAYCYYSEKRRLYPRVRDFRMTPEVLETFTRAYIASQDTPEIVFAWQGGEPTLLGLPFFRLALELQRRYRTPGKRIVNALQTNGLLLDDSWAVFLAENGFLVGLSIDGPRRLHDCYRRDRLGRPTFAGAERALDLLKRHGVEFNALAVVHRHNADRPLEVYRFLRDKGVRFIQFIPVVERTGGEGLAGPPTWDEGDGVALAPWSVDPDTFGEFLCDVFDAWVRRDVGRVHVQFFDVLLEIWLGEPAGLCVLAETCGRGLALEHNGDLYVCDHYVYPRHRLGNILESSLAEMANDPRQVAFGLGKRDSLPRQCRDCELRFACNGGCPKHRFLRADDGEPGLNYLCSAYRRFFRHADPWLCAMARLLSAGRAPAEIMTLFGAARGRSPIGRNDPCPCGSGRKFKKCCGGRPAPLRGGADSPA